MPRTIRGPEFIGPSAVTSPQQTRYSDQRTDQSLIGVFMNKLFFTGFVALLAAATVQAAGPQDAEIQALHQKLSQSFPKLRASDISRTPAPGLFEVSRGLSFGYVTQDGKYFVDGDLIDLSRGESLTEKSRKTLRLSALDDLGEDQMVVFPAKNEKHVMTVFTDIDCGYCRKLHREMAQYNAQGITVRYLFYPRSGPNTASFKKAENVWCAQDRNEAMTEAKQGREVDSPACSNPVMAHYRAGQELGVRGTPALILDDGSMRPGYVPAAQLGPELARLGE